MWTARIFGYNVAVQWRIPIATAAGLLIAGLLSTRAPAETAPTTQPLPLPSDTSVHITDICRLRVEQGRLVLHSRYVSPVENLRVMPYVVVQELGGCNLRIVANPNGGDVPQMLMLYPSRRDGGSIPGLTRFTFSDSGVGRSSFNLRRNLPVSGKSISLTQGVGAIAGFPIDAPGRLVFTVYDLSDPGSLVTRTAPDWRTLRRQFGADVDQFLRPTLCDLHQYALFAVEPIVAWQVFADEWKPDPGLERRIRSLLPGLDAERFSDRDLASGALRREGVDGALTLHALSRKGLSLEQRSAIDAILADYLFLDVAEINRCATDAGFLLDCLYCTDAAARRVAVNRLARLSGRSIEFDVNAPEATRDDAVAALREQILSTAVPATRPVVRPSGSEFIP